METTAVPQYRTSTRKNVLPEVESFLHLLVVIKLIDNGEIEKV